MKIAKGADRYVVGKVGKFDQKNHVLSRPLWDPSMLDLGRKFFLETVMPRDKPGYMLQDLSLLNAAWHLEMHFAKGVRGG